MTFDFWNHGRTRTGLTDARPELERRKRKRRASVLVCGLINHGLHGLAALTLACFGMAWAAVAAEPTILVEARQRYPWNGLVDVHFTITGDAGTKYDTSFTAKDMVGNTNIAMRTIRKADGTAASATEQLLPGTYNWVWDTAADLPKGFKCNRVRVAGTALDEFPYSVKFNANGGTGTMANESFTYGTAKALTANAFTRTGYTFQGWATSASGAKVYNDKQSVSNLTQTSGAVVNLYAVWKVVRGKVQLWEGGPYWAETNIGAEKPEEYGYYFWWGGTTGYRPTMVGTTLRFNFNFSTDNSTIYTYDKSVTELQSAGWVTSAGVLAPSHDAAHVLWGGNWRMPTGQELCDLNDKCDWTWTTTNGVKGYIVRGRGAYASNSIFLPAAGYGIGNLLFDSSSCGYYWSSVPYTNDSHNSRFLHFTSSNHYKDYKDSSCFRGYGQSVRPVQ